MRLLNTHTRQLSEFFGKAIPKYAILSHRWEEDEITLQDIQLAVEGRELKKGWAKLEGFLSQALKDGFEWAWDDTCCIDKSSSAELSETINSMFSWYRASEVCYVYLSDVALGENRSNMIKELQRSRWFTRGWTLQELLAPKKQMFFDRYWVGLGSKVALKFIISQITGITNIDNFDSASVAQKMSWVAERETTRIEDMAYSMLGLFGVNMPPLYGEGERAFVRLQREILLVSDDETIFAWKDHGSFTGSLLAHSPAAFKQSRSFTRVPWDRDKPYYLMTNKGLRMECPLLPPNSGKICEADDTFLVPLQCETAAQEEILAVIVRRVVGNRFARISSNELIFLERNELGRLRRQMDTQPETRRIIHVSQISDPELPFPDMYFFAISADTMKNTGYILSSKDCSNRGYLHQTALFSQDEGLLVKHEDSEGSIVVFEYTRGNVERPDELLVVISLYAHRPRLVVCVPNTDVPIDQRMSSWAAEDWRKVCDGRTPLKDGNYIKCLLKREKDRQRTQFYTVEIGMTVPEFGSDIKKPIQIL